MGRDSSSPKPLPPGNHTAEDPTEQTSLVGPQGRIPVSLPLQPWAVCAEASGSRGSYGLRPALPAPLQAWVPGHTPTGDTDIPGPA